MKQPEYNIGDKVYYNLPDSGLGIVLDIRYFFKYQYLEYLVSFGKMSEDCNWYEEAELNTTQVF